MTVLTQIVAPTLGSCLGLIMLLSPIKAVLEVHAAKHLGDINPLPYPMTLLNCIAWVIYGAVTHDPFIAPANIIGCMAGSFFTMTVFPFTSRKIQTIIQAIFLLAAASFGALSMVDTFALNQDQRKQMWGSFCVSLLIIYYVIPLSTFYYVIKTRDASSIYLPLAIASIANGGLWTVYGLAIGDINIWGPNSFGAIFGTVQVVTRLFIGAKSSPQSAQTDGGEVRPKAAPVHFGLLRSWSRRTVYVSDEDQPTLPSFNPHNQGSGTSREKSATDAVGGLHLFDGFAEFTEFRKSKSSNNLVLPPTIPEEEISEDKPLIRREPGSSVDVLCSSDTINKK
jgi:solute carrier family 50 protein (sugar transporter)